MPAAGEEGKKVPNSKVGILQLHILVRVQARSLRYSLEGPNGCKAGSFLLIRPKALLLNTGMKTG